MDREKGGRRERERERVGEERAYFEMVILVPDSAMILFRVLPPFPTEQANKHISNHTRYPVSPIPKAT